jgi:hypothetical protein
VSESSEQTAEKIAGRGREALIARLRPAFEEAAAAHADVLELSPEQIEEMIQRAANRADGLQWRRALAAVATEELGISLGEALSHPDVVRAHELVGAPSYEDSLAELSAPLQRPAAEPAAPAAEAEGDPAEASDVEAADAEAAEAPLPETEVPETEAPDTWPGSAEDAEEADDEDDEDPTAVEQAVPAEETAPPPPEEEAEEAVLGPADPAAPPGMEPPETADDEEEAEHADASPVAALDQPTVAYDLDDYEDDDELYELEGLRITVIHLGGIANLEPAEKNIELLMSVEGLDIIRSGDTVLGRLDWEQVRALEVPPPRGRRRRRNVPTHLVIRTIRGDASFEVPEVTPEELRRHLAPVIDEHLHGI